MCIFKSYFLIIDWDNSLCILDTSPFFRYICYKYFLQICALFSFFNFEKEKFIYLMKYILFLKKIYVFIWERQRESTWGGRAEGENLQIDSPLRAEPNVVLYLTTHETTTPAKPKSQTLTQLSHPGTPRVIFFLS